MIDQLCVFLYSRGRFFNGFTYCYVFSPIYVMRDGFKKVSVVMCDRYLPFCHPDQSHSVISTANEKRKKKPTQIQVAFSINIAGAAKAHYFCHEFLFFRTEKQETYFSALHIHVVIDVTIWSVTRV